MKLQLQLNALRSCISLHAVANSSDSVDVRALFTYLKVAMRIASKRHQGLELKWCCMKILPL